MSKGGQGWRKGWIDGCYSITRNLTRIGDSMTDTDNDKQTNKQKIIAFDIILTKQADSSGHWFDFH